MLIKDAIKRVHELTEIPKYSNLKESNITVIAAHTDDLSYKQLELINKDIEEMEK